MSALLFHFPRNSWCLSTAPQDSPVARDAALHNQQESPIGKDSQPLDGGNPRQFKAQYPVWSGLPVMCECQSCTNAERLPETTQTACTRPS